MFDSPSIWAVVPCFNRSVNTLRFLSNFSKQDYPNKHVVIVDDGSSDNTGFNVKINYPDVHVVFGDGSLWWSGGTNLGINFALNQGADYILTINDDSQYENNLITTLYETAKYDPRYIVGAVIVEEGNEDTIWSIGASKNFDTQRLMHLNFAGKPVADLSQLQDPYPVEFMPGNGVLLPRSVFETVGFYDEVNLPQYHADSELILRAAKEGGFIPVIALKARIINQILTKPLVSNVTDLLFSKKSDLYWPALATFVLRHYPEVQIEEAFNALYSPFGVSIESSIKKNQIKVTKNFKYIFYGAYGAGNLGDDLLLLGALNEYRPNQYLIISYGKPLVEGIGEWLHHSKFIENFNAYVNQGDILVFGGGGIFWSEEHCRLLDSLASWAKVNGAYVHIKKIGTQGLQNNPKAVLSFLSKGDQVTFRDENSGLIVKQFLGFDHFVIEEDYVSTLGRYIKSKNFLSRDFDDVINIGVNHAQTDFFDNEEFRYRLINIYNQVLDILGDNFKFHYIPQVSHYNEKNQNDVVNGELFSNLSNSRISSSVFPRNVDELLFLYSKMDLFVGCRFHGMVISKLMDKGSVLITNPCGAKYEAFALENNIPIVDLSLSDEIVVSQIIDGIKNVVSFSKLNFNRNNG